MALSLVRGVGPAKIGTILQRAKESHCSLDEFLSAQSSQGFLTATQAEQLTANVSTAEQLMEQLGAEGIQTTCLATEQYPKSLEIALGIKAPPILYWKGNAKLFDTLGIAICGSRQASPRGLATTIDVVSQLSAAAFNILSGHATGIDTTAHVTALKGGGTTTLVLPEGLTHFRIRDELMSVWDWDRVLVISQFAPSSPWSIANAMFRNSTLCGLAQATVVIESKSTGGSIAAGQVCLDMKKPLFTTIYGDSFDSDGGNQLLIAAGAAPLATSNPTERMSITPVVNATATTPQHVAIEQLSLF